MDLTLSVRERELQEKAAWFAKTHLFPERDGDRGARRCCRESPCTRLKQETLADGFNAINHAREHRRPGLSLFAADADQRGARQGDRRASGPSSWHPAMPLKDGTPEQIRDYLEPSCRGERRACVADHRARRRLRPAAGAHARDAARRPFYLIRREMVRHLRRRRRLHHRPCPCRRRSRTSRRCSWSTSDPPGVRIKREPKFMHTYVFGHPEFVFEDVEVGADEVLGRRRRRASS